MIRITCSLGAKAAYIGVHAATTGGLDLVDRDRFSVTYQTDLFSVAVAFCERLDADQIGYTLQADPTEMLFTFTGYDPDKKKELVRTLSKYQDAALITRFLEMGIMLAYDLKSAREVYEFLKDATTGLKGGIEGPGRCGVKFTPPENKVLAILPIRRFMGLDLMEAKNCVMEGFVPTANVGRAETLAKELKEICPDVRVVDSLSEPEDKVIPITDEFPSSDRGVALNCLLDTISTLRDGVVRMDFYVPDDAALEIVSAYQTQGHKVTAIHIPQAHKEYTTMPTNIAPNTVARFIGKPDNPHLPTYGIVQVLSTDLKNKTAHVRFEGFGYTVPLKDLVPTEPEAMIVVTCKHDSSSTSWTYPKTVEEALNLIREPRGWVSIGWGTIELTVYELDFGSHAESHDKYGVPRRVFQHWIRTV